MNTIFQKRSQIFFQDEDFFSIFEDLGLHFENKKLPLFNISSHKDEAQYYGRLLKYLVKLRVKKDISLLKHRNKQLGCRTIYGSRFYPEIKTISKF